MQFQCTNPLCRQTFRVLETEMGRRVPCPWCGTVLNVPALAQDPAPAFSDIPLATAATAAPVEPTDFPPYLAVPEITDPKLTKIPSYQSFQIFNPGEELIKSYQIRVRRPKLRWGVMLIGSILAGVVLFGILASLLAERERVQRQERLLNEEQGQRRQDRVFDDRQWELEDRQRALDDRRRRLEDGERRFEDKERRFEEQELIREEQKRIDEERERMFADARKRPSGAGGQSTFRQPQGYEWLALFLCFVGGAVGLVFSLGSAGFLLVRVRGHTFLYLTNQRVTILELEEGIFQERQSVLSFSIDDISGFQLFAQRGLKKLLGLILLKEKRTFYLTITTRTSASVAIGAINSRGSKYDPGRDAVSLCSELDTMVLSLRKASHG